MAANRPIRYGAKPYPPARRCRPGALQLQPPIDRVEGEILPEDFQTHIAVVVNIAFPEFDESSIGCEYFETPRDELAGQRIQNNIDAASVCDLHDAGGEIERSGVEDVGDADRAQIVGFLARSGGRNDIRTCPAGNLDGGQANSTGGGVNQHPVTAPDTRQLH